MVYQHLRKADKRHERDRIQWSDTYKRIFEVIARGRGEALIEGLNFGAAYDTPPFFEFAVVREGEPTLDIKAVGFTHPGGNLVRAPGGHTGQIDNWFYDGSFEHHGMWDSQIVQWDQYRDDDYQKIYVEQSVLPAYVDKDPWGYARYANCWVQQPTHNLWAVTSEKAHAPDMGLRGKYSAKFTFQTDNEISGWLIPILSIGWPIQSYAPNNGRDQHYYAISHFVQQNHSIGYGKPLPPFYPEGGFNTPGLVNPLVDGMNYEAWVWSDQDCTMETWVNFWHDYEFNEELGLWVKNEQEDRRDWPVKGGQWNKVEFTVLTPGRLMPGLPDPKEEDGSPAPDLDHYYATTRFRMKDGVPGQQVFFDDALAWAHFTFNDNPFVTVGVSKWIVDAAGAYIGADLWVKVGEPEYAWD